MAGDLTLWYYEVLARCSRPLSCDRGQCFPVRAARCQRCRFPVLDGCGGRSICRRAAWQRPRIGLLAGDGIGTNQTAPRTGVSAADGGRCRDEAATPPGSRGARGRSAAGRRGPATLSRSCWPPCGPPSEARSGGCSLTSTRRLLAAVRGLSDEPAGIAGRAAGRGADARGGSRFASPDPAGRQGIRASPTLTGTPRSGCCGRGRPEAPRWGRRAGCGRQEADRGAGSRHATRADRPATLIVPRTRAPVKATGACTPTRRRVPAPGEGAAAAYRRPRPAAVGTSSGTHTAPDVRATAGNHPRIIRSSLSPTSGPCLQAVSEVFLGIVTRYATGRGGFTSVSDLSHRARTSSTPGTPLPPFTWTKTADDILPIRRQAKDLDRRH